MSTKPVDKNSVEYKITRARIDLLNEPFFGGLLHMMPMVESNEVNTMATDGKQILWNRAFAESLTIEETRGVIVHELMHPILGHLWRFDTKAPGYNHQAANVACDIAGNEWLKKCEPYANKLWKLPDVALLPVGKFKKYEGKNCEFIYRDLMKNAEELPQMQMGGEMIPQGEGGKNEKGNDGKGDSGGNEKGDGGGDGKDKGDGDSGIGELSQADLQSQWEAAVYNADLRAKARGNYGGNSSEAIQEMGRQDVSVLDFIRQWASEASRDDYSWRRRNMRYAGQFILPALYNECIGEVVIAIDTSGSMSQKMLAKCLGWTREIITEFNPRKVHLVQCDTRVNDHLEVDQYSIGELDNYTAKGRGGTDFRPMFQWVSDNDIEPAFLLYLTDLCGPFPDDEPDYPVIWADTDGYCKAPWGIQVEVI